MATSNRRLAGMLANREALWLGLVVVAGFMLRFVGLGTIPGGLNSDEASVGVEALSILQSGSDIWGNRFPIYFPAFGSGLNPLSVYLSVPIVGMFGLSAFSIRLINATFGALSIPVLYAAGRTIGGHGLGLIAAALLAFLPWGFMASRWAVESNLLPFWYALGILAVALALRPNAAPYQRAIAFIPWAIGMYAYSAEIPPIVFSSIALTLYYRLTIQKNIAVWLLGIGCAGIIVLPLLIFHLQTTFHFINTPIHLFSVSFPSLAESRLKQVQGAPIQMIFENFVFLVSGFQDRSALSQSIFFTPLTSLGPLLIAYGALSIWLNRGEKPLSAIPLLCCIGTIIGCMFMSLNLNRFNAFLMPGILVMAFGLDNILKSRNNSIRIPLFSYILASLFLFHLYYFRDYNHEILRSDSGLNVGFRIRLKEAMESAENLTQPHEKIYLDIGTDQPYLWPIFFGLDSVSSFKETRSMALQNGYFKVNSFGRFIFDRSLLQKPYTFVSLSDRIPCADAQTSAIISLWAVGRCPAT